MIHTARGRVWGVVNWVNEGERVGEVGHELTEDENYLRRKVRRIKRNGE